MAKKIMIAGTSGMIGGHLLDICLKHPEVQEVHSIVRRPSQRKHDKLKELVIPNLLEYQVQGEEFQDVDIAYCCIGVYTGAVSREEFRKITIDIPLAFARLVLKDSPNAKYCLLSGAGADRTEKSRMMFAKDKGIVENKLADMAFRAFHTFRPGYIYPVVKRKEPNLSYQIFRYLYPIVKLFGQNSSIRSTDLAQGMFNVGMNDEIKQEIFENREILQQL